ncbi:MAG: DUF255 domain-containing protein [Chitinophagales bacterium]|nr:DUF255 domain-containing protein [Chitinophagales bacterium]
MKTIKSLFLISTVWVVFSCTANSKEAENTNSDIKWMTFEEAVHKAQTDKNPKNIFIDFYTSWCGWCKVMDKKTFTDPNVAKLMNKYFYPVKFDAEGKDPIVFNGHEYNFVPSGRNGYHQLAADILQGKLSYPTFVFLSPDFKIITPIAGFVQPQEFEPIINFIGQDKYINDTDGKAWEQYKANYVSGQDK